MLNKKMSNSHFFEGLADLADLSLAEPKSRVISGGDMAIWGDYIVMSNGLKLKFDVVKINLNGRNRNSHQMVIDALKISGSTEDITKFQQRTNCTFNSNFTYYK